MDEAVRKWTELLAALQQASEAVRRLVELDGPYGDASFIRAHVEPALEIVPGCVEMARREAEEREGAS